MRVLFLTRLYNPHIGGVERHAYEIGKSLVKKKNRVIVVTEKYDNNLRDIEVVDGLKIFRVKYPRIKIIGLFYIWWWLLKNRNLINRSDIIHCHDVFIWYLPFRFLYPNKKVFTTFHGWEGKWPIPTWSIFLKKISAILSSGSIMVGKYIGKYYGIKADVVIHGGSNGPVNIPNRKIRNSIVFLGRLDEDTGLLHFLKYLDKKPKLKVEFLGDGPLRYKCEKYGVVHGFTNPMQYLIKAEYCVPGGYLSYIEARDHSCKILTFPNNPLKKDYWSEIQKVDTFPSWGKIADEYISLYNSTE